VSAPGPRQFDGKKFMWDGAVYAQEADAERAAQSYREARFEVRTVAEGGEWLVYTRRKAAADAGKS
jgi:hypothetical protein